MPTNLPPEFFEAESRYKKASDSNEKIKALEEMLSTIPKHKGTDKLRADYRKKLSRLKSSEQHSKKTGKFESEFHIDKEGDARIVVLGMPNSGKSSLISLLTHAKPEVSENPYTTWHPVPGMYIHKEVALQLIDTPPLNKEYIDPELIELIKTSDIIIMMLDLQEYPLQQFDDAFKILEEHKIFPHHKKHENLERAFYYSFILAVNKDDAPGLDEEFEVLNELLRDEWNIIPISTMTGRNIDGLFDFILRELKLIRVYTKPPGHEVDYSKPFILKKGSSVEMFAAKVHKDFVYHLKTARVWGKDVFDGQPVGKDHILNDGDIVELHL